MGEQIAELEEKVKDLVCEVGAKNEVIAELQKVYDSNCDYSHHIEEQLDYAKSIIKSLLDNSDEYAEQRARDFLEGEHER